MRIEHWDDVVDRVEPDQRFAFVGPTGCGKSHAMGEYLKHMDNVVLVAPKRQWDWHLQPIADERAWERQQKRYSRRAYAPRELDRELRDVATKRSGDPIAYLPPMVDDAEIHYMLLDYPFRRAMERGHTLGATDDLYFHGNANNVRKRAPWLFYQITGGRGLGNGTAYAFQRPVWVPKVCLSETEHFASWYLAEPDDRDEMDALAGGRGKIDWNALLEEEHALVYFERGGRAVSDPIVIDLDADVEFEEVV